MLAPIDIVTRGNRKTGRVSNPEEANNKGYWHRGAHVFIFTPTGRVLIQKRSPKAMQHPGKLDIGAGGFVDSGELPSHAAARETKEEVGLDIDPNELIFLGITRYNRRWKFGNRQKINRTIIYNYALRLPHEHNVPVPDHDEVTWAGFVPLKSALWLLSRGSSRKLGRLTPTYAYYRKRLKQALRVLELR